MSSGSKHLINLLLHQSNSTATVVLKTFHRCFCVTDADIWRKLPSPISPQKWCYATQRQSFSTAFLPTAICRRRIRRNDCPTDISAFALKCSSKLWMLYRNDSVDFQHRVKASTVSNLVVSSNRASHRRSNLRLRGGSSDPYLKEKAVAVIIYLCCNTEVFPLPRPEGYLSANGRERKGWN